MKFQRACLEMLTCIRYGWGLVKLLEEWLFHKEES
jgi:hypothetical protein